MKKILVMTLSIAALAGLAGCVEYDDGYGYGPYDGPYYYNGYYDGYYDGYYGPYVGGYWGTDGVFYYSDGHGDYDRDYGHHFRRERFEHGRPFRAMRLHDDDR